VAFIGLLQYARYGYAPKERQAVSVSTPPESDPRAQQVFSFCEGVKCACSCSDPFDPRTAIASGVYAGLCLNSCALRNVLRLDTSQVASHNYFPLDDRDTGLIYAANVYHRFG
jgi:hypothetical protein